MAFTFGTSTSTFGSKPNAFGTGSTTTGGGLFGSSTASPGSTGGLFGTPTTSTNLFGGGTSSQPTGGLFGSTSTSQPATTGFGFGTTQPSTGTGGGLFGTSTAGGSGGGLFGQTGGTSTTGGFGGGGFGGVAAQQNAGTSLAKFTPTSGQDSIQRNGAQMTINTKIQAISAMKQYETKSFEELRIEDYMANRKGPSGGLGGFGTTATSTGGMFSTGGFSQPSTFGASTGPKPLFGGTASSTSTTPSFSFGQPSTATSGGFGTPAATSSGGLFGSRPATGFGPTNTSTSGGLFGQKPAASGGLFGSNTFGQTQANFGAATSTGGGGLFGNTATSSGFGSGGFGTQSSAGGGLFGTTSTATTATGGSLFGGTSSTGGGGLFGSKPTSSTFGGTPASTGGFSTTGTFGATGGGGLFGQPNKPLATTGTAGFGAFSQANKPFGPTTGTTGAFSFQSQPGQAGGGFSFGGSTSAPAAGGSLFGNTQPAAAGGSLFGGTGATSTAGSLFGNPTAGIGANQPTMPTTAQMHNQWYNTDLHQMLLAMPTYQKWMSSSPADKSEESTAPFGDRASIIRTREAAAAAHARNLSLSELLDSRSDDQRWKSASSHARQIGRVPAAARASQRSKSFQDALHEAVFGANGLSDRSSISANNTLPAASSSAFNAYAAFKDFIDDVIPSSSNQTAGGWSRLKLPTTKPKTIRELLGSANNSNGDVKNSQEAPRIVITTDSGTEKDASALSNGPERPSEITVVKGQSVNLPISPTKPEPIRSLDVLSSTRRQEDNDRTLPTTNNSSASNGPLEDSVVAGADPLSSGDGEASASDASGRQNGSFVPNGVSENRQQPHPAGVILERCDYFIEPSLNELASLINDDGRCIVRDVCIGREGYGTVFFPGVTDLTGLNLDEIVHIQRKSIYLYPDEANKPPVGEGLNKPAQVTLDCVYPLDKSDRKPITDVKRLLDMEYGKTIELATIKMNAKFIDYRPDTGSWIFEVDHFSKYGLDDDSEADEGVDEKPTGNGDTQLSTKSELVNRLRKKKGAVSNSGLSNVSRTDDLLRMMLSSPPSSTETFSNHELSSMLESGAPVSYVASPDLTLVEQFPTSLPQTSTSLTVDMEPVMTPSSNQSIKALEAMSARHPAVSPSTSKPKVVETSLLKEASFFKPHQSLKLVDSSTHTALTSSQPTLSTVRSAPASQNVDKLRFVTVDVDQEVAEETQEKPLVVLSDCCRQVLGFSAEERSLCDRMISIQMGLPIQVSYDGVTPDLTLPLFDIQTADSSYCQKMRQLFRKTTGFGPSDTDEPSVDHMHGQVVRLCDALWGPLMSCDGGDYARRLARWFRVGFWLEETVGFVEMGEYNELLLQGSEKNRLALAFSLLLMHRLEDAAELLYDDDGNEDPTVSSRCYYELAMLCVCGLTKQQRALLTEQWHIWRRQGLLPFINENYVRILRLLSGMFRLHSDDYSIGVDQDVDDVLAGRHWVTVLCAHYWYRSGPPNWDLASVLADFEESWAASGRAPVRDVRLNLLRYYADGSFPLERVFSEDDASVGKASIDALRDLPSDDHTQTILNRLAVNLSDQLLANGMAKSAVFVGLHVTDVNVRFRVVERAVRQAVEMVLWSDSADKIRTDFDELWQFLVEKLNISVQLLIKWMPIPNNHLQDVTLPRLYALGYQSAVFETFVQAKSISPTIGQSPFGAHLIKLASADNQLHQVYPVVGQPLALRHFCRAVAAAAVAAAAAASELGQFTE